MATDLQRDLAEAIVINKSLPHYKRKNKKDLLVSVGYDLTTAEKAPTRTLEQKGVKDTLKEWGLTEELITTALVYDIENKPKSRVKELSLGADILNMTSNKDINISFTQNNFTNEEREIATRAIQNILN